MTQKLSKIQQRVFPRITARIENAGVRYREYVDGRWREAEGNNSQGAIFGQEVLLVPERQTLFRVRSFPHESVKQSDLAEAVELDLDLWCPWEKDRLFYFWPARRADQWIVAIWVWQASEFDSLVDTLAVTPTHIMPERAWKIAAMEKKSFPAIYIDQITDGKWSYAVLGDTGVPLQITEVSDKASAQRFWYALDKEERNYPIILDEGLDPGLWPDTERAGHDQVTQKLPAANALRYARQPGVKDWSDPFSWSIPLAAVMALYVVWLLGSSLILWRQGEFVGNQVAEAKAAAIDVLDQRTEVERIHRQLEQMQRIRSDQRAFEKVLAALSLKLPKGAWLTSLEFNAADGGWIDILGNAEQSVGLAAVLEEMPEVEHAMFLNDIRRDKRTGLEPFKIRLKLGAGK